MASQAKGLLSEECRDAINRIASYELHVSDAYLSMACYYIEDSEAPTFHTFFQDQADVKREHAKQFIKYLRKYKCKICLPVIKRPDIDNWGTGKQALPSALQLENELNKLLQDLKASASRNRETNVSSKRVISLLDDGLLLGNEPQAVDHLMSLSPLKEVYELIS